MALNTDWTDELSRPRMASAAPPDPALESLWNTAAPPAPATPAAADWGSQPASASPAASKPNAGAPAAAPQPGLTAASVLTATGVSPRIGTPAPMAPADPYGALLSSMQAATDPNAFLVEQDRLARRVSSDLTAAGHAVEWGDTGVLMVDGRPYELGTGAGLQTANLPDVQNPDPGANTDPNNPDAGTPGGTPPPPAPPAPPANPGPQNGDVQGWFMSLVQGKPVTQETLLSLEPTLKQAGWIITPPNAAGERTKVGIPDGRGGFDWYRVGFGEGRWMWIHQGNSANGAPPPPAAAPAAPAAGASWWDNLPPWMLPYVNPSRPPPASTGGMPNGANYDALIGNLLQNPDVVSPHLLDSWKASDAEEEIEAAGSADEALKRFGYEAGYADSPWLASERASTARSADQGIIRGRRQLEGEAAKMNADSRVRVAQIGAQYFGLQLNLAQFNQSGEQFQRDFVMKLLQLAQQDDQFAANLGLAYDQMNQQAEQWWADHDEA